MSTKNGPKNDIRIKYIVSEKTPSVASKITIYAKRLQKVFWDPKACQKRRFCKKTLYNGVFVWYNLAIT